MDPEVQSDSVPPIRRINLKEIATSTIEKLEEGSYEVNGTVYDLSASINHLQAHTSYYAPDSDLSGWSSEKCQSSPSKAPTEISVLEISTLEGARLLSGLLSSNSEDHQKIGVLNFASAKNPGGGFLSGARAQEESLARSSTLYPSLMTTTGQKFYKLHKRAPKDGYYSHSMIYSPRVLFIRDDNGNWKEPIEVDIVVSAAVNAGLVRRKLQEISSTDESGITATMKERMGRILYLFERQGVKNLVLGSFGTGVFRNNVDLVASIWADLLTGEGARFRWSFDKVVFAILGNATFNVFEHTFNRVVK